MRNRSRPTRYVCPVGLFSKDDKKDPAGDRLQAEHDRLDALTLDELAGEILHRAFGPATGNGLHRVPIRDIHALYDPSGTGSFPGLDLKLATAVRFLVEEGLQHLEHAGLVVQGGYDGGGSSSEFHLSRAGRLRVGG